MRYLSKKTVMFGLGAILLLSIVLRYPLVEHERFQADSYALHHMSQSIVDYGYSRWIYNPLSYVGFYPLSYPSGVPFVISELSILCGSSVEVSILLLSVVLGALFALGTFILAREFIGPHEFVLLAVLLVTLGPRFVDTTYWVGSARGPLVVIMLLAVATLIRFGSSNQKSLAVIGALFVITCFTLHHMAVLLVVFGLAYILSMSGSQYLYRRVERRQMVIVGFYSAIVAAVLLGAFGFFDFFSESIIRNFVVDDYIFDFDSEIATAFSNMAASYVHQMGFVLLFAVIYGISLVRGRGIGVKKVFPVVLLLLFVPLLGSAQYLTMLLLPFVVISAALWFRDAFGTGFHLPAKRIALAALIVTSLILPVWSTVWWNDNDYITGDKVEVDAGVFNDMVYLNIGYGGQFGFANTEIIATQFSAASGINFVRAGVYSAINGDFTEAELRENLTWSDAEFPVNLYSWFEFDRDIYNYYAVRGLSIEGMSFLQGAGEYNEFAREYFSTHQQIVVIVDNEWPESFVGRWDTRTSQLLGELKAAEWTTYVDSAVVAYPLESFMVYQSGRITEYMVEIPQ